MRIEQPQHLKPFLYESFRLNTRLPWWKWLCLYVLMSAFSFGLLVLKISDGELVSIGQWIGGGFISLLPFLVPKALFWWLFAYVDRFAEVRDGRVRLGKMGYSFKVDRLVFCKIEPDENFPKYHNLRICFRPYLYSLFKHSEHWSMMVEDLEKATKFQHELTQPQKVGSRLESSALWDSEIEQSSHLEP